MRIAFGLLALTLIATPALAITVGGIDLADQLEDPVATEGPREDLIEGWNDDQPYQPVGTYAAGTFGFQFIPSATYYLQRIEWYAGGVGGTVTVSLLEDTGSGYPDGPVLGSATYTESATPAWQGQDLEPGVCVEEGVLYYIRYDVVVGADTATAASGEGHYHYASYDGGQTWSGPWGPYPWMARFYGTLGATPVQEIGWGELKAVFR